MAGTTHPSNSKAAAFGGFGSILGAAISKATAPQPEIISHTISKNPPNLKQGSFSLRGLGNTININTTTAAPSIGMQPSSNGERKGSAQITMQE